MPSEWSELIGDGFNSLLSERTYAPGVAGECRICSVLPYWSGRVLWRRRVEGNPDVLFQANSPDLAECQRQLDEFVLRLREALTE